MRGITVFGGTAHPHLSEAICRHLGEPLAPSRLVRFANDCLEVRLESNCRERDVFLIQPLVPPVQEKLVELHLMVERRPRRLGGPDHGGGPVLLLRPLDKKDAPRISIGGRLVADLLVAAGADRMLTMTLHAPQVHAFFSVPVDHLHALRELAEHFSRHDLTNTVVVSPDLGNAKSASAFARRVGVPVAAGAKQRFDDENVEITSIIGDVEGRDVIVLDDEIARGSTVIEVLDRLAERGAGPARVATTHGLFAAGALERIGDRDDVVEIVCTDTVPLKVSHPKLTVLSVAPALAEAIRRIHGGESVSALFHEA